MPANSPSPDAAAANSWPDLAGHLTATGHVLPIRVYFEDTDFSGLVYHASYIRWCERGRSDFLRLLGQHHHELITGSAGREPAAFVVRRMELDYLAPARIDEVLEVHSRVAEIGGASALLEQTILRQGRTLFAAKVTVVLVGRSGKVLRIGDAMRAALF